MDLLVETDVAVLMRDGSALVADVWRPSTGPPVPALLQRTPYNKAMSPSPEVVRLARAGYAVVVQDVRGRNASPGEFVPFAREGDDGEDTVEWVAAQPWCDGHVGTLGPSYIGAAQWLLGARAPDALKAMAPAITADDYYEGWTYTGGALQLGFLLTWGLTFLGLAELGRRIGSGEARGADMAELIAAVDDLPALFEHTPVATTPHLGSLLPAFREWLDHPAYDEYWRELAPRERHDQVTVPTLNIGGWYDIFLTGTLANYRGMRDHGGSPAARRPRLLIGPWSHVNMTGRFPERGFGLAGSALLADLTGHQLRWFDHVLKGTDNGVAEEPPVRLFVLGVDAWSDEEDWPPPDARPVAWYLHADGRLSTAAPEGAGEEPSSFTYDPRDPVPTEGGATFLPGLLVAADAGPRDQRAIEQRDDVLTFTGPPLERELTVIGPITLSLWASSSARDTDFTAKLVDVHPDGRAELLCDGILRARYRDSFTAPEPLVPGERYEMRIDVGATANVFRAGHRIRLEVSSSNFPRFDRNTNTGGCIAEESAADFVVAHNRVFHDAAAASFLTLSVVDREWA